MIEHVSYFRVMYPDTDKMGTVHHSNYARYYETARWELFRAIGIPYQMIETAGYMMPVISMNMRFLKTTRYDEQLTVRTCLKGIRGPRVSFSYKLYNTNSELINEADTELAFVKSDTFKPCAVPPFVTNAIQKHLLHSSTHASN
ncbi:acyl-CoA thioester hydrolase [Breznakibacter xylanolyticus]|uniref:Acyl-CoA thioester hydrolase n=1 Tax=Breznakibacter xylanolyticus TaxID=990 RepID=A0A2W7NHV6_9BACT|nr:thioesterase family protein [Breznakibacter xylanolyticus]PZX20021.1 acyl-CoA thioester hydrolase [Breznakibacter xylanolyticus]